MLWLPLLLQLSIPPSPLSDGPVLLHRPLSTPPLLRLKTLPSQLLLSTTVSSSGTSSSAATPTTPDHAVDSLVPTPAADNDEKMLPSTRNTPRPIPNEPNSSESGRESRETTPPPIRTRDDAVRFPTTRRGYSAPIEFDDLHLYARDNTTMTMFGGAPWFDYAAVTSGDVEQRAIYARDGEHLPGHLPVRIGQLGLATSLLHS